MHTQPTPRRAFRGFTVSGIAAAGIAALLLLTGCTVSAPEPDAEASDSAEVEATGKPPTNAPAAPSASPMPLPTEPPTTPSKPSAPETPATPESPDASAPTQPYVAPARNQAPSATDSATAPAAPSTPPPTHTPKPSPEDSDGESSTIHDDELVLYPTDTGEIAFSYNGTSSGDSFSFVDSEWNSPTLSIAVKGTHDNSTLPASDFAQWTNYFASHTAEASTDEPSELHYAFCGTLAFADFTSESADSASTDSCFGQGSDGLNNNWWGGGADYVDNDGNACFIDPSATNSVGSSLVACLEGTGVSEFEINDGGTSPNYFSLYSPNEAFDVPVDPQQLGDDLLAWLQSNSTMSPAKERILQDAVDALPTDGTITTPTSWEFTCDDYCATSDNSSITSGQVWGGVHTTDTYESEAWKIALNGYPLNNMTLNATAGRDNSAAVASWFDDQVTPSGAMIGAGTGASTTPGDLNFAYCGDLSPQGGSLPASDIPICFGQGHNVGANNWWIGGADWQELEPTTFDAFVGDSPLPGLKHFAGAVGGDTETRVMFDPKSLTAVVTVGEDVANAEAIDGFMFIFGIG
ncbi:hypothetical protein FHX48_001911 [Microbacterium halimionae]|uniref:Uncharacterized protein n=1 Tax=Microbacterium halimionae TaxID=1526413 RepID=A0A7W3JPX9_9MICO|nr:hypothetical protein [Microbacterium halimionae]MBA8816818.1 hypothetical protein [Microbacterium halimionae]NII94886.1 hypothetical protein [Microbacterium halimionae]